MSSEDSEDDGLFTVHSLPWRSEKATSLILSLDNKHKKKQSRKSKIMTFDRKDGTVLDRHKPTTGSVPAWAIKP